jgi:hypothetical protein
MKPTDPPQRNMAAEHGGGHAYTPEEMHNEGVGHEGSDVNIRAILGFGAIVAAVTIACSIIVWGVFVFLEKQAVARDPRVTPLAKAPVEMPRTTAASPYFSKTDGPPLVTDEPSVLRTLRESENARIHQYGWIDEKGGVARLPIDQAKKLIAERGLPSRTGGTDDARLGTHAPAYGESTGGRTIPTGEPGPAQKQPAGEPGQGAPQLPKEPPQAPAATGRGGA